MIINDELLQKSPKHRGFYSRLHAGHTATIRALIAAFRCQNTGIYSYKLLLTSQMSKQMDLQLLLMVTTVRCQNTGIYSYKLLQSDVLHGPTATVTAVRCQNTGIQLQVTAVRCFTRAYSYSYCSQMSKHRDLQLQVTTQSSR